VGRDSSVGIATRYGLDGTGSDTRYEVKLSASVQTDPGAHPDSYAKSKGSFLGIKRLWCGADHPPPNLSPRLKNEYRYTSTPHLGFSGLLCGDVHPYLYLYPNWDKQRACLSWCSSFPEGFIVCNIALRCIFESKLVNSWSGILKYLQNFVSPSIHPGYKVAKCPPIFHLPNTYGPISDHMLIIFLYLV